MNFSNAFKISFCTIIFVCFSHFTSAQYSSYWYDLDREAKEGFNYNIPTSKKDLSECKIDYPVELELTSYKELLIARANDSMNIASRKVPICLGIWKSQEVMVIDEDNDGSISLDEIHALPKQELVDSIPYNELYYYPSTFSYSFDVEYEYFHDNELVDLQHSIVVKVFCKYDSTRNELYYTDIVKAGHYHRLSTSVVVGNDSIRIVSKDYLPWQNTISFYVKQSDIASRMGLDQQMSLKGNQGFIRIDSFDFVNKRILISKVDSMKTYSLKGNLIDTGASIDLDSVNADTILIHYWGIWCGPCKKFMPKLKEIYNGNSNITVIGVAVGGDKAKTEAYIKDKEILWSTLFFEDEDALHESISHELFQYPTYVLLNKNKQVLCQGAHIDDVLKLLKP